MPLKGMKYFSSKALFIIELVYALYTKPITMIECFFNL